jgi:hypothetical protein
MANYTHIVLKRQGFFTEGFRQASKNDGIDEVQQLADRCEDEGDENQPLLRLQIFPENLHVNWICPLGHSLV